MLESDIKLMNLQNSNRYSTNNVNETLNLISSMKNSKTNNIKEIIEEISLMIHEREELKKIIILGYDNILSKISTILSQIKPDAVRERILLEEKSILIEEAKVREIRECWKDIAILKKELRLNLKDFKSEETKSKEICSLLE
jgi:hypothetical protein